MLCLSGRVAWGRLTPMDGAGKAPLKSSPIALMLREHAALWRVGSAGRRGRADLAEASAVYEALRTRGASFFHELVAATGLLPHARRARARRARRRRHRDRRQLQRPARAAHAAGEAQEPLGRTAELAAFAYGVDTAGRWALLPTETQ